MAATAIAIIYSPAGKRSGAHVNPGVTLAFLALRAARDARRRCGDAAPGRARLREAVPSAESPLHLLRPGHGGGRGPERGMTRDLLVGAVAGVLASLLLVPALGAPSALAIGGAAGPAWGASRTSSGALACCSQSCSDERRPPWRGRPVRREREAGAP
jgi:hypothetical protein